MDDFRRGSNKGGSVEPQDRAAIAKQAFQTPTQQDSAKGPRFELRDATTDLVYHSKSFDDIAAKADRLGALRFTSIDENGQRSFVNKVAGLWQRPPGLQAEPEQQREATAPAVKDESRTANVVPIMPGTNTDAVGPTSDPAAERLVLFARLEAALNERYVIKRAVVSLGDKPIGQTEYRFRGDTSRLAFTESTFRLATDTNSPSVARSMVDVAQARDWKALRVSGHEEFRRMVWFEASLRGVKTVGYEPMPSDMAWLRTERETRQVNRIEPTAESKPATGKASARGSGSRKTVLAAIEAVLVAQRVPAKRREAIITAAADNLAKRLAAGEVHKVKVYGKAAPSDRTVHAAAPELQRSRERAGPTPVR